MNHTVRSSSQFSAVPFYIKGEFHVARCFVRGAPWQPPPLYGLIGSYRSTPDQLVIMIIHEMPLSIFPWLEPISKRQLEELHLQKFSTDFYLATGERPYSEVTQGGNPPDFRALTKSGECNVECTQFALERRREAYALFDAIKKTILKADPSNFSHLAGLLVYVWVNTAEKLLSLPLGRPQQEDLIRQLAAYHFVPGSGQTIGANLPLEAPDLGIATTPAGWQFYATPILVAAPLSVFFTKMGFELAFVYPTEHTPEEGWQEVARLVQQHDRAEINDLVITVGGPDRMGTIHPAEEAVFDFMLDSSYAVSPVLQYVGRVFAHGWETGRIIQVHPEVKVVSPGQFVGAIAAHQSLSQR